MRKTARRTLAKVVAAVLLLLAAGTAAAEAPGGAVVVTDAWVGAAPPTARNRAAFFSLKNGPRPDRLLGVKTPAAEVVELHETRREQGVTRMQRQAGIALAPREEVVFAPGGRHLMLINVRQPLQAGDKVPLTLKFRRAGTLVVEAEVRPLSPAEGADSLHGHHR